MINFLLPTVFLFHIWRIWYSSYLCTSIWLYSSSDPWQVPYLSAHPSDYIPKILGRFHTSAHPSDYIHQILGRFHTLSPLLRKRGEPPTNPLGRWWVTVISGTSSTPGPPPAHPKRVNNCQHCRPCLRQYPSGGMPAQLASIKTNSLQN